MKPRKIRYLEKVLRWMAIATLKRHKPKIIGITGSVGKTSTKEAVYCVLSAKFGVGKNEKNYNNEIGIPLAIIGASSGGRSLLGWLKVFYQWLAVTILPADYPKILILEMGVDSPGDMKYLTSFVPVNIGIVTAVCPVHLERFKSLDHIGQEKGKLIEDIPTNGFAILNADDDRVAEMKSRTKAKIITFGFSDRAAVRASDASLITDAEKFGGISFKLNFEGKTVPVRLRRVSSPHHISSALAAIAVGIIFKINLVDIASSLEDFSLPPGRMNIIAGDKNTTIIDDTYNSSPVSLAAAIKTMEKIKCVRRIVVLGDMLELGAQEQESHKEVGRKIYALNADLFFAVGERMKTAISEVRKLGFPSEKVFHFDDPATAARVLVEKLKPGDLILVKGSQSMRMEKIVEKIMDSPEKAAKLLCRQSEEWWRKPYIKP